MRSVLQSASSTAGLRDVSLCELWGHSCRSAESSFFGELSYNNGAQDDLEPIFSIPCPRFHISICVSLVFKACGIPLRHLGNAHPRRGALNEYRLRPVL